MDKSPSWQSAKTNNALLPNKQTKTPVDATEFSDSTQLLQTAPTPSSIKPSQILQLQRLIGNQRVQRWLASSNISHLHRSSLLQRVTPPSNLVKAQSKYNRAVAKQTSDRAALLQIVQAASTQNADRRLQNAAKLVTTNKLKMYALTLTGDSDQRVRARSESAADYRAWFPKGTKGTDPGDIMSPQANYNWGDLDDNTNVEIDTADTGGWELPGLIAIVDISKKSADEVRETLRHEGQHATDESTFFKHQPGANQADLHFNGYKTEYRAYSYEGGSNDNFSTTKLVTRMGRVWREKQWEIFKHIYDGYKHTKKGWDNDMTLSNGTKFRDAVVNYIDPDDQAMNKYDSYDVLDYYRKLYSIPAATNDATLNKVKKLRTFIKNMSAADAEYVLYESLPQLDLLYSRLADPALQNIQTTLNTQAGRSAALLNFTRCLMVIPNGTANIANVSVQALLNACAPNTLNQADASYIYLENKTLMKKIQERLQGKALQAVLNRLNTRGTAGLQVGAKSTDKFQNNTFFEKLNAVTPNTKDVTNADVQALLGTVAKQTMNKNDAKYILENAQDRLKFHLIDNAYSVVTARLQARAT